MVGGCTNTSPSLEAKTPIFLGAHPTTQATKKCLAIHPPLTCFGHFWLNLPAANQGAIFIGQGLVLLRQFRQASFEYLNLLR